MVAGRAGTFLYVQCKAEGAISPGEWNDFLEECGKAGAVAIFARKDAKRHIEYFRLTGPNIKFARDKPMEPFEP